jgi:hypothetical protein
MKSGGPGLWEWGRRGKVGAVSSLVELCHFGGFRCQDQDIFRAARPPVEKSWRGVDAFGALKTTPTLGGRMSGGGQGRGRPVVQQMREVYLQCNEKMRQLRGSFISIEEMHALIAAQCPVCNTSAQI